MTATSGAAHAPADAAVGIFAFELDVLLTDTERLDHGAIPVDVLGLEIVQEPTALADQHEQAATRMVILRVHLEVLGEIRNPFRKQSDLNFGRPGITGLPREFLHDCRLTFRCEGHCFFLFLFEWSGMCQKKWA